MKAESLISPGDEAYGVPNMYNIALGWVSMINGETY